MLKVIAAYTVGLGRLALGCHIRPWVHVPDINHLDIAHLKQAGIRGIALDVDNTLTVHHAPELYEPIAATYQKLKKEFKVILYSNCNELRYHQLTEMFDVPVVEPGMKKPSARGFQRALQLLDLPAEQCLMVGDRALTDIVGGNKNGFKTALVDPFEGPEPGILTNIRRLERWRLRLMGIK